MIFVSRMANAMGGECRGTGIKDIELPGNLQSQLSAINEEKDHVHAVTESKVGPDSKRNRFDCRFGRCLSAGKLESRREALNDGTPDRENGRTSNSEQERVK